MKGFNPTPEQIREHQRRHGFLVTHDEGKNLPPEVTKALRPVKDRMNKTEREFSMLLEAQKRRGEIVDWIFEGMRLKWGEDPKTKKAMWYKPDFVVNYLAETGNDRNDVSYTATKIIEVKGPKIWDRDIVRFKGCRAWWPQFEFEMHQRDKEGRWTKIL